MTKYVSTRGGGRPLSFTDVLMTGLAPDGGLYVPDRWPLLDYALLDHLAGLTYGDIAMQVMKPFVGDAIDPEDLRALIADTYENGAFGHGAVAPLAQVGPNAWIMELFHGPTLSFKDYALQLVGRMFDYVLAKQGRRLTIVGATSGDTGSAAIEACRRSPHIDIFILHPKGRTSDVQRRQMTSVDAPNVFNIAVEGTFDDCQAIVKTLFGDEDMRRRLNLSAVNSINWARIMAQTVYYVAAAVALGAPGRHVSFAVPTGNFGNVYAAWAARRMGLPVRRLVIGSNRNDILTRFFETGAMTQGAVQPSLSPSMDIQVSSNFERYLFDLRGHDPAAVRDLMAKFQKDKSFRVADTDLARARDDFTAARCTDDQTLTVMKNCYDRTGYVIDPHTAVGMAAAAPVMEADPATPMVMLACAHPAKFPAAVKTALGFEPRVPPRLASVMKKAEHLMVMPNDASKIRKLIENSVAKG